MANKFTDAVFQQQGLTMTQKLVLNVLAFHSNNETGESWPSRSTIEREAGLSRTAVKKALRELKEMSAVEVVGSKPSKYGAVNIYKITAIVLQGLLTPPVSSRPRRGASGGRTPVQRSPQNSSENSSYGTRQTGETPDPLWQQDEDRNPPDFDIGEKMTEILGHYPACPKNPDHEFWNGHDIVTLKSRSFCSFCKLEFLPADHSVWKIARYK